MDIPTRVHIGLEASDIERSVAFYRLLFGTEPSKTRPGYAKFEPGSPQVNLSLVENRTLGESTSAGRHFGIEVPSTEEVARFARRLAQAGHALDREDRVDCCYAVQDKVWVSDPDGNRWEVFTVLGEGAQLGSNEGGACCDGAASAEASEVAEGDEAPGGSCCG